MKMEASAEMRETANDHGKKTLFQMTTEEACWWGENRGSLGSRIYQSFGTELRRRREGEKTASGRGGRNEEGEGKLPGQVSDSPCGSWITKKEMKGGKRIGDCPGKEVTDVGGKTLTWRSTCFEGAGPGRSSLRGGRPSTVPGDGLREKSCGNGGGSTS